MVRLAETLNKIITTHHNDPDENRRARILNIILVASFVISILALLFTAAVHLSGQVPLEEALLIYIPAGSLALSILIMYQLNKTRHAIASTLFLLMLIGLLSASDEPGQIAGGRSQLFLSLPIIMSSIVLPAWSVFLFAGLVSIVVNVIGITIGISFTPFSTFAFFVIALVSYLGASQLEQALGKLRRINEELDQRVAERTRELVEANQQLAQANDRLRELDQLKSRFLSMVSHELRTPLSAIQGFAEILIAEIYGPVTPGQRNALERITNNAGRLLNLVGDLLDRARIEAGQITLHPHFFSPAALMEDVHSTLDVIAQSKGLSLTAEVAPDLPVSILGDEARLRQILVNLVNNALKFTEKGGVTVSVGRQNGATQPVGQWWMISVSDTGPGIADKDRAYIFEPFRRVDDSATRKEMGVGLGLSIVRDLVELMHGTVNLESELGHGSTFTIVLPLKSEEEECDA